MESKLWYTLSLQAPSSAAGWRVQFREVGKKLPEAFSAVHAVCKTEWGGVEGGIRRWCSAVQSRVGRHYPTLLGRRSQFYPEQYLPPCPMPQLTSSILMRFNVQEQEQDTQPYRSMFLMYIYVYFEIFQNSWRSCQCHGESYSGAPMVGDKEGKPMHFNWIRCWIFEFEVWMKYEGFGKRFVGWKFLHERKAISSFTLRRHGWDGGDKKYWEDNV